MRRFEINLRNTSNDLEKVSKARIDSLTRNHAQKFSIDILKNQLKSPDTNEHYILENGGLTNNAGKRVPIQNGIADFTIFSNDALDEKERQASFHDDEEINERFDEIVLRPFNYNHFHAKIWLKHLKELCTKVEGISGKTFDQLSILNCGCGGGFEAQFFAQQGANVVGFDISQLRVEASATRFALNGLTGFFYRGDAAILPFDDDCFDCVIYHDSLHHVPIEEIPKAIKEARRVSKNLIVLSEANDSPLRMFLESIGKSTSIEASGNYAFRFKKNLMIFWCYRFGMRLRLYKTYLDKREHRPALYNKPFIGKLAYYLIQFAGKFLAKFGNGALIILEKTNEIKYMERRTTRSYVS